MPLRLSFRNLLSNSFLLPNFCPSPWGRKSIFISYHLLEFEHHLEICTAKQSVDNSQLIRFNIEPFFWSSSLNWIPSRYQENPIPGKGDRGWFRGIHGIKQLTQLFVDITICLTFLRSMPKDTDAARMDAGYRKSIDSVPSVRPSTLST